MTRTTRSLAVMLLAAIALSAIACGGADEPAAPAPESATDETAAETPEQTPEPDVETTDEDTAPLRSVRVQLYFPAADDTVLVGEAREIFDTAAPEDRAKQILSDLLSGPEGQLAIAAVPRGVRLRQVYVLPDGIAYADFSRELAELSFGGSASELTTVYAIVNSVTLNVPEIRRLGILVDGQEIDTLAGHLDLRRALPPRTDLIREPEE